MRIQAPLKCARGDLLSRFVAVDAPQWDGKRRADFLCAGAFAFRER
jgi:hypothetical protein